jgi:predicted nucleotidyltransferase
VETEILQRSIIFECITGSKLYGTATSVSDTDIRGVFIPPEEYYFGFLNNVEQVESKEPDVTYWEIRKFFKLCLDNNPNILELLFIPHSHVLKTSSFWEDVISNRELFLSTKARHTFAGYAVAQLHRIKQHREWLLNPIKNQPQRSDFGLPNEISLVTRDQLNAFTELTVNYGNKVSESMQIDTNFLDILHREKAFLNANKHWGEYENWKKNRNPDRAKLEEKFGYDTKHASHLARLTSEGAELLTTGVITFPRYDAEELLKIRNGGYSYDELMKKYGEIDKTFESLEKAFVLPHSPDRVKADKLCQSLVRKLLKL